MKKCIPIFLLLITLTEYAQSQNFYFAINPRFYLPLTYQASPEYFTLERLLTSLGEFQTVYVFDKRNKFSIAKGASFGATFGFCLNNSLSSEIGLDYFDVKRTVESDYDSYVSSDWHFKTLNVVPEFSVYKHFDKYTLSVKSGPIIGLSSLEKTIYYENTRKTYKFNNNLSLGYIFGFEYDYSLNGYLSLIAEFGTQILFYTPKKAVLTEYLLNGHSIEEISANIKEIEYVKDINFQEYYYDGMKDIYASSWDEPSKRFIERLKLNSVFLGIGVKYKIGNNEKN